MDCEGDVEDRDKEGTGDIEGGVKGHPSPKGILVSSDTKPPPPSYTRTIL